MWFNGSGPPDDDLGFNGDYYLNNSNGHVYFKELDTWDFITNITGPQGAQGNPGTPGINTWGSITGTLSNQTDLQSALNAKGSGTVTSVNITPPVGYSAGSAVTSSGNIALTLKVSQVISASDINWSSGQLFRKTITGNTTFTFSNSTDGQVITVVITAGSGNTVTWPVAVKWPGDVTPTQTSGKTDVYTFINSNGTIRGSAVQAFS